MAWLVPSELVPLHTYLPGSTSRSRFEMCSSVLVSEDITKYLLWELLLMTWGQADLVGTEAEAKASSSPGGHGSHLVPRGFHFVPHPFADRGEGVRLAAQHDSLPLSGML